MSDIVVISVPADGLGQPGARSYAGSDAWNLGPVYV